MKALAYGTPPVPAGSQQQHRQQQNIAPASRACLTAGMENLKSIFLSKQLLYYTNYAMSRTFRGVMMD